MSVLKDVALAQASFQRGLVTVVANRLALVLAAGFALVAAGGAWAADPTYNSYRDKGAVRGHDVVAYFSLEPGAKAVKGKPEHAVVWQGVAWYFSSAANLQKFKANPEAYAPQYGGYCAFASSKNFTTSIRPNSWLIHNGKLYLNHNWVSKRMFISDLEQSIEQADANWPALLKRCEKRGNCRRAATLPVGLEVLDATELVQYSL